MTVINPPERKLAKLHLCAVVRFTRFLFGGFTTAAIVIQPDGKLVIPPLCSSKIAKARPNSAEWPEYTSVQISSP